MEWEIINFGKFKGRNKTLPQILFLDADWFFHQYERENSYLKKSFGIQADYLYKRAKNIKPKMGHYIKHYIHPNYTYGGFSPIAAKEAEQKYAQNIRSEITCQNLEYLDTQEFFIYKKIDLSSPRRFRGYDKQSCRILINQLNEYLSLGKVITEKRAIEFFENDDNFILD